jgi:hypothetical protein
MTAPAHPAGPSEVVAATAIANAELEQFRAAAARYVFLRTRFLRRPVNVNAWGQPSYGVTVKAPHDLTAHDFDRLLDALNAADDGISDEVRVPASLVSEVPA